MNETMQTILTRRSTRKFKVQEIPQTDLDQILKAALHSPSGMGKQTWQFTVVGLALCGSISFRESAMSLPFVKF